MGADSVTAVLARAHSSYEVRSWADAIDGFEEAGGFDRLELPDTTEAASLHDSADATVLTEPRRMR